MNRKTVVLATVSVAAAAVFGATIAVPAAQSWFDGRHDQYDSYASGTAAKDARASVPRWLPDDAGRVEYGMKTTGGDRILTAKLASAQLPKGCTPGQPAKALGKPALNASWFPSSAHEKAAARCEQYYAYLDGDTLHAWQYNDDWIASNKATPGT
ncbi:hypothetical protein ABT160_13055 [Streptomyces sp. NPDC001941]|uniref:hypothetical protein n=1 Tax=Streptomyces sp. NPDC001941 TaxID=3154659 RepID=UPI0033257EF5